MIFRIQRHRNSTTLRIGNLIIGHYTGSLAWVATSVPGLHFLDDSIHWSFGRVVVTWLFDKATENTKGRE